MVLADTAKRVPWNVRVLSADGSSYVDLLMEGLEDSGLVPLKDSLGRAPINIRLLAADGQSYIDPEAIGGGGAAPISVYSNAFASPPASPVAGDLWFPSDSDYTAVYSGSTWLWRLAGYPITMPVNSQFAWHNQKSGGAIASVDITKGGIYLEAGTDAADSIVFRTKALPATPYDIQVRLDPNTINANYTSWGFGVRNSANDDFLIMGHYYQGDVLQLVVADGDDLTITHNDGLRSAGNRMYRWFRITDNGTLRTFWFSDDGYHWNQYFQHGHTDVVTPNQAFFAVNPRNGDTLKAGVWLRHWKES